MPDAGFLVEMVSGVPVVNVIPHFGSREEALTAPVSGA
jgi:hypothetical protein